MFADYFYRAFLALAISVLPFVSAFQHSIHPRKIRQPPAKNNAATVGVRLQRDDDSSDFASPLSLSMEDIKRMDAMKTRHLTMPLMILDSMVPRQELQFESKDPKFARLIQYCLQENCELGMLGVNPHTGRPLCRGVTLVVDEKSTNVVPSRKSIVMSVTAGRRIEVQGEPWLDESGSFYMSNVEILEGHHEPLSVEHRQLATQLSKTLPNAMEEWSKWVIKSGATDEEGLKGRLLPLGPMPTELTDLAFWVAAAINPLPALGVCLEIRPAMLTCTNDYERIILACQAVQSSIDHLSGKRKLF